MSYQKFKADFIFTGTKILPGNHILITDEHGIVEGISDEINAGKDIQTFSGVLTPGFVNCHCHLELSHMHGVVPDRTGLIDFLITVMQKRNFENAEILDAIRKAEQELYAAGTIAVGDICNTTDSLSIKEKSKLHYYNFIEATGFSEMNAGDRFAFAKTIFDQFFKLQTSNFKLQTCLTAHAPYSVSKRLFALLNDESAGKTITIHNQECIAEEELFEKGTGGFFRLYKTFGIDISDFVCSRKNSLRTFLPQLNKAKNIILVHNTYTSEEDIEFADQYSQSSGQTLYWCLCPNANLYIENQLPPVNLLQQKHCNIVLGTDSYASNRSLNLLDEMKTILKNFQVPLDHILQWATLNGARALQMDKTLGSFEKDKQPGVVLIEGLEDGKITEQATSRRII